MGKYLIIFGIKSWHKKSYFHRRTCFGQTIMDFKFFLNSKRKIYFLVIAFWNGFVFFTWMIGSSFYNKLLQIWISARERKEIFTLFAKMMGWEEWFERNWYKLVTTSCTFWTQKKGWNAIGNLRFHVFYFIWLIH